MLSHDGDEYGGIKHLVHSAILYVKWFQRRKKRVYQKVSLKKSYKLWKIGILYSYFGILLCDIWHYVLYCNPFITLVQNYKNNKINI